MCDTQLMLDLISESKPEHTPGEQTKYHYLTFGWIVEGLVRGVTGGSLREFVRKNIGEKLNIEEEFMIGIPCENKKENQKKKGESESESESDGQEKERQIDVNIRIADLVLGRIVMPSPPPAPASTTASTAAATAATAPNSDKVTTSSTVTGKIITSSPPLTGTDIPINKLDEVHTPSAPAEEVLSRSYKKRPPSGPSMLMNPTFFNNPRIR